MITKFFNKFSPTTQAHIILAAGVILFLNALNIIKGLNVAIIAISVAMIWYGFVQAGYDKTIKRLLSRKEK